MRRDRPGEAGHASRTSRLLKDVVANGSPCPSGERKLNGLSLQRIHDPELELPSLVGEQ